MFSIAQFWKRGPFSQNTTHDKHTKNAISRTPQTLCKMKHSGQNYTPIYKHILSPYETHTLHINSVWQLHTAVANL